MKTATILFYVSPSIETRIKSANTIDLMEGGKEQAQNVPNSEINRCDEDGKEGHADGSSRDVPIESGEVDSSSGEESSSPVVVRPRPRLPRRNQKVFTSKDSSGSSSDSSYSSSSGSSSDSSDFS